MDKPFLPAADIHHLYASDFFQVLDFKCRCTDCNTSKPEYSDSFTISFIRKGNFRFNVFRRSLDSFTGRVLVSKPRFERTVTHLHTVPDECTILDFKEAFYQDLLEQYGQLPFFRDPDWHSTLVHTTGTTELLHFSILRLLGKPKAERLLVDQLVLDIIGEVFQQIEALVQLPELDSRLKKNHLDTIERAKEFMMANFTRELSLQELSQYCHISPFHFSRVFKTFTGTSPHQFLVELRMSHAEILLLSTLLPVSDIAFSSGFTRLDYFTAAFHMTHQCSPSSFRLSGKIRQRK